MSKTLSIIIPLYNEEKTILKVLDKIKGIRLLEKNKKEVIVVNDCSTDTSQNLVTNYKNNGPELNLKILNHTKNQGKGACIQYGIKEAQGEYIIIQDADLEYNPEEYNLLLQPIIEGHADVVYGSRFVGGKPHRVLFFSHTLGNRFLTLISNLFTGINITDMEVGYKLFKTEILKKVKLQEKRFGFEPEVTAKISRIKSIRIYEVGISYYGRTYMEGKKIGWKDGVRAIYCLIKYNVFR